MKRFNCTQWKSLGSFKNVIHKMSLQIIFFFIIQRVKARAIPYPHQPPSRGDNTVSVAQGGTATPGATKQLFPPDRVLRESFIYIYIYIYIYTPDPLNAETTLDVNLHFLSAVYDLKKKKKKKTRLLSAVDVITRLQ